MSQFDHRHGRHFDVGDAQIYAECVGAAEAPVLVVLHGGFGNLEDFNVLLPMLGAWRVVGIDSRGHGASTLGTKAWTYRRVQDDIQQVLRDLGVARCTLLGFSDGGIVALRMGAARKIAIDRIVVIGATWHHKNLAASRGILQKVTGESWKNKFPDTYDAYQRQNPEPDFDRLAKSLVQGWLDETVTGHPDDTVKNIEAPVLIIRGDDDHLTTLEDAAELKKNLPDGHFLGIPFAGHVAYVEGKDCLAPALRAFLGS